jgi:hypothetical protein
MKRFVRDRFLVRFLRVVLWRIMGTGAQPRSVELSFDPSRAVLPGVKITATAGHGNQPERNYQ